MISETFSSSKEKIVIIAFLLVGVMTFVFGFLSLNHAIVAPFARKGTFHLKTAEEVEAERLATLKAVDTDHDGLSDYDELYVYRTSPFLTDSDSDGIPDGVEVARGTDPNCPEGKVCRAPKAASSAAPPPSSFVTGDFQQKAAQLDALQAQQESAATATMPAAAGSPVDVNQVITEYFGDVSNLSPDEFQKEIMAMAPDDMRAFMAKLGVPKDALDKASDDTVRQVMLEALNEAMSSNSAAAPAASQTTSPSP